MFAGPDDTTYAPYDHELVIEFHSRHGMAQEELGERLGRAMFDRLSGIGSPLAHGEVGGDLFAEFLAGRGVRDFPPGTDYEEPARIGRLVARTLRHPCADAKACGDPTSWITGVMRQSLDTFSLQTVSIDVHSDGDGITAVPHLPYKSPSGNALLQGQASETLAHRGGLPGDVASLGGLLTRLTFDVVIMRTSGVAKTK